MIYYAIVIFALAAPEPITGHKFGAMYEDTKHYSIRACTNELQSMIITMIRAGKVDSIVGSGCNTKKRWIKILGFSPWDTKREPKILPPTRNPNRDDKSPPILEKFPLDEEIKMPEYSPKYNPYNSSPEIEAKSPASTAKSLSLATLKNTAQGLGAVGVVSAALWVGAEPMIKQYVQNTISKPLNELSAKQEKYQLEQKSYRAEQKASSDKVRTRQFVIIERQSAQEQRSKEMRDDIKAMLKILLKGP